MTLEHLKREDFDGLWQEMEASFVKEERRDKEDALKIMDREEYCLFHTVENGERVGFVALWVLEGFVFLEHFVTYEKYRNKGIGRRVLDLLKEKYDKIVLEAEHPESEMSRRRIGFYRRSGFFVNDYPYIQPPYRKGESGVPLLLLSYPSILDNAETVVKELKITVYR